MLNCISKHKLNKIYHAAQELWAFSLTDHRRTMIIVHICGSCNILIVCHCFTSPVNSCGHVGRLVTNPLCSWVGLLEAVYQYLVPILASNWRLALLEKKEEEIFSTNENAGREGQSRDRCIRSVHANDRATTSV